MRGIDKVPVFPMTTRISGTSSLEIGGCTVSDLVAEYGTPLYIFDEVTIRNICKDFLQGFQSRYPNTSAVYASKAFMTIGLAQLLQQEEFGLDVVSGGEIAAAVKAGLPMDNIYFHGNNKTGEELQYALDVNIGRIVVDNIHELGLLENLAEKNGTVQSILLRVSPGVDPHTHVKTTTGILDSKFGLPIVTGQAEAAVEQAMKSRFIDLVGLHFHLGSPIWDMFPYEEAIPIALDFAQQMSKNHGMILQEFSPGGGFAVRYLVDQEPPTPAAYANAITDAMKNGCDDRGIPLPKLIIEPGRAIVGQAGVAIYTVGAIKTVPGIRTFVAVDGGMGDNIRPALYEAEYEAVLPNRMDEEATVTVTIAGKYCESGDILVRDVPLPPVVPGDLIGVPVSGAYCLAMSSNYNMALKPAVVLVRNGKSQLWRRRETYEDLYRNDIA
jgi:diaminopimelate decarboxylase